MFALLPAVPQRHKFKNDDIEVRDTRDNSIAAVSEYTERETS